MATYIAHDGFARQSYLRVSVGMGECRWCGQSRNPLYAYTAVPDDRLRPIKPARVGFCNKSCFDSYYG